jgi:hypothetical protein
MLLTDGAWVREGSCSERPDLLLPLPRRFNTKREAVEYKNWHLGASHVAFVSKVRA